MAATAMPSLLCTICGDSASAFNFGVLSCESCKAFFRRATRRGTVPVCVFSGDCPVSLRTRRFCVACRLRKCERAGMNKSLVLSEEQRKARQHTIEENRLRKCVQNASRLLPGSAAQQPVLYRTLLPAADSAGRAANRTVPTASTVGAAPQPQLTARLRQSRSMDSDDEDDEGEVESLEPARPAVQSTTASGYTIVANVCPSVSTQPLHCDFSSASMAANCDVSDNGCSLQYPDDTVASSVLHPSSQPLLPPLPLELLRASSFNAAPGRILSSQTCGMLDFLTRLYRLKLVTSRRTSVRRTAASSVAAVSGQPRGGDADCRLQQLTARLRDLVLGYVLFSRELPDVAQLPLHAQLELVKACAPAFILIRAAELYDEARAAWVDELGDVVSVALIDDLLREVRCAPMMEVPTSVVHCRHQFLEILSAIKSQVLAIRGVVDEAAQTTIAVLQAIALLSPEQLPPGVIGQDALDAFANAQQRHVYLLRQHIEATCSFEAAAELLPKLLCTLETCKRAARCLSGLLLSCDVVCRDELLAEILDARLVKQSVPSSASYPNAMLANGELLPTPLCSSEVEVARLAQISSRSCSSSKNGRELSSSSSSCAVLDGAYSLLTFADNMTDFGLITSGR